MRLPRRLSTPATPSCARPAPTCSFHRPRLLSIVRDASDRDYRVFVLVDGGADPGSDLHDLLTSEFFPRQAHVITIAELPDLLAAA